MNLLSAIPIPLVLLLAALGLMATHVRAWRAARRRPMEDPEREYRRRQFRRRMQASGMLALLAVGIFAGQLIPSSANPTVLVVFWGLVMVVLAWVALLAVADMVATKYYYGRLRQGYMIEQAKLEAQLRRMQAARRNGQSAQRKRKSNSP